MTTLASDEPRKKVLVATATFTFTYREEIHESHD